MKLETNNKMYEDFFCNDTLKPRKIKPQNIVNRLINREMYGSKKSSHTEFYQCIFPNFSIVNVDKPPCFLRKFSPDGKYLIAFSFDQSALEIYKFQGCSAAQDLIYHFNDECTTAANVGMIYEIRTKIFNRLFKVCFEITFFFFIKN